MMDKTHFRHPADVKVVVIKQAMVVIAKKDAVSSFVFGRFGTFGDEAQSAQIVPLALSID